MGTTIKKRQLHKEFLEKVPILGTTSRTHALTHIGACLSIYLAVYASLLERASERSKSEEMCRH